METQVKNLTADNITYLDFKESYANLLDRYNIAILDKNTSMPDLFKISVEVTSLLADFKEVSLGIVSKTAEEMNLILKELQDFSLDLKNNLKVVFLRVIVLNMKILLLKKKKH